MNPNLIPNDLRNTAMRYQRLLSVLTPFVLSFKGNWEYFNLHPFNLEVRNKHLYCCLNSKNAWLFDLLQKLDGQSFGPSSMAMEKWVFFDCGEMPGGIAGFLIDAKHLSTEDLSKFGLPANYQGMVPVSMYIAIPMALQNSWFGHNLSSANKIIDFDLSGLGLLTKAIGIEIFKIRNLLGATQWNSSALHIHLQLSDMKILSSYTPAHSHPNTMTYQSVYSKESLINSLDGTHRKAQNWDLLYPKDDLNFSKNFQKKIEKGKEYSIIGRPIENEGQICYPIKEL